MNNKITIPGRRIFFAYAFFIVSLMFSWRCAEFENPVVTEAVPAEFDVVDNVKPDIWIKFSKPMNKQKTEKSFSLSSAYTLPKGTFTWEDDKTLKYELTNDLEYGGYYSIKMASSAEDTFRNKLDGDYLANFFVGSSRTPPSVSSVSPVNMNFNASPTDIIVVTFSKPMKQKETEQAFSISPAASGIFSWNPDSTVMTFTALEDWKFSQTYKISVKTTAKDQNSAPLMSEFSSYFRVGLNFTKPTITSIRTTGGVTIVDGTTNIEKTEGIVVVFDKPMNFSSVQSAFSITDSVSGSIIAGTYTWATTAFDQFTFTPNSNFTPEGLYKITLTTNAKDSIGNPLNQEYVWNISILGINSRYVTVTSVNLNPIIGNCTYLGVLTVTPLGGYAFDIATPGIINQISFGQLSPWSCPAEITFSAPMDVLTVPGNIVFERITGTGPGSGLISCGANSCYNWNLTKTMVTILLNDMANDYGEYIYKLSITGGSNGVLDQQKNYLEKTLEIYINPVN